MDGSVRSAEQTQQYVSHSKHVKCGSTPLVVHTVILSEWSLYLCLRNITLHGSHTQFHVSPDDGGLIYQHRQQQLIRNHVVLLVSQVHTVFLLQVAQNIHRPIQMGQGHNLPAHKVVQTVVAGVVNEAVADKASRTNFLGYFLL
jgi:hypothetical protein